jgi:phosphoserine phosphatase
MPASIFNFQSLFHTPFEIVIFDCDSTLSTVEGIDELARWVGKEAEVAELTNRAMNGELPLEAVYSRRLELLRPTREHLQRLAQLYRDTVIPDAAAVIHALRQLGREVFIVSGGLAEGVREFGLWLGLPEAHIHAVEVEYNQLAGRWWETWKHPGGRNLHERYLTHDGGPLTVGKGKAEIIRRLRRQQRGRALLVGDGTSDLEAGEAVDLFVGFGGVVSRERVRAAAPVFIHAPELAPVLPLTLGRAEVPSLFEDLYTRGLDLIREGRVTFRRSGHG